MARNAERDRQEAERRKGQLIRAGFELFSRDGIESVSLNSVAERAGVGASTMYKYFQNKVNLVVAISGRIWGDLWASVLDQKGTSELATMNPQQLFELYADVIIGLYLERPQVLRFSANYKTYIQREHVATEDLGEHLNPLEPIAELFFKSCKAAADQGCVRIEVSVGEMFSFEVLTMLTMAERYAQGIVWTESPDADHVKDLQRLKGMLSAWMKGEER